ncbi:hypothetical protein E2C01_059319 [Portunus trituberculatus]|uniref:Uncharacterized protein n=1 Tax=Portunus trituberculatus TaxID=210409 RepID=A0A5B7H807_PORTR|nr:hypothetical protein [Portunus trituberculatus]
MTLPEDGRALYLASSFGNVSVADSLRLTPLSHTSQYSIPHHHYLPPCAVLPHHPLQSCLGWASLWDVNAFGYLVSEPDMRQREGDI